MGRRASRRDFLKTAGLAATVALMPAQPAGTEEKPVDKPNVVLILVDDLGYGDLSSYGAEDMRTPHIDGMVEQGVRFDRFYANCPVCSPTRASVLTGRYPDFVGVPGVIRTHREDSWGHLSDEAVLLPTVLKTAGYHTAIIGKWHLGLESPNTPTDRGFDFYQGFLGDMMDDYYTHRRHGINYMVRNKESIDPEGHATDLFSQWACDYIAERAKTDQPFFLYLAYNAPHTPVQPPQEWLDRVQQREPGIDPVRAKLVALIEHMDDGVGKVLAALRETGAAENTLVLFTSDNGGQLDVGANNGPLRDGKQAMYEGGIREPMCAVWPGRIPAGSRTERIGMTMDLFPTFCEACGATFDHAIEGRSILPALLGEPLPPDDRILFWVRRDGGDRYGGRAYYAARQGDWKLVQNTAFEPLRLYNLETDPLEEHPVETEPEIFKRLFVALQNHICDSGIMPWQRRE